MNFSEMRIDGAYTIDIERQLDERGFFARAWCQKEFAQRGLAAELSQVSIAHTAQRGTLRGLHYQAAPHEESKVVRCTRGAAFVVVADLRRDSATFAQWQGVELTAENHRALYVPPGCAQGYQTLVNDTELLYQMSVPYAPSFGRGVRYDDPLLNIAWPLPIALISAKDEQWPPLVRSQLLPQSISPLQVSP